MPDAHTGGVADGEWGNALWLSALAAAAALGGLGVLAVVVIWGSDAQSRPDSGVEWMLYGWLLLLALVVCLTGLGTSVRLYRRAFGLFLQGARRTDRDRPSDRSI